KYSGSRTAEGQAWRRAFLCSEKLCGQLLCIGCGKYGPGGGPCRTSEAKKGDKHSSARGSPETASETGRGGTCGRIYRKRSGPYSTGSGSRRRRDPEREAAPGYV